MITESSNANSSGTKLSRYSLVTDVSDRFTNPPPINIFINHRISRYCTTLNCLPECSAVAVPPSLRSQIFDYNLCVKNAISIMLLQRQNDGGVEGGGWWCGKGGSKI